MTETIYPQRTPAALAICYPRWDTWIDGKRNQPDPCGGCPLHGPCVQQSPGAGLEAFSKWVKGVNDAAAAHAAKETR